MFYNHKNHVGKNQKSFRLVKQYDNNNNLETTINNETTYILKEKEIIKQQVKYWKTDKIQKLIEEINQTELTLKKYSMNPVNLISNFLLEKSN